MKLYNSFGELLKDYREHHNISRIDFASSLDVDIRTVARWENNDTLLKANIEEDLVDATFIPYQVIRNLNAPVSIPTYYDFSIRKYATSEFSNELPDINWLKSMSNISTDRLRTTKHNEDLENIIRASMMQAHILNPISKKLILKAADLLPALNFIIYDTSGYYSGHSVFLPLKQDVYQKIRNRSMTGSDITIDDLVDSLTDENFVYYS